MTAGEILERALEGNARFRAGKKHVRDWQAELRATAGGQAPAAVVLGCIDSRAPAEIIFDQGLGNLFNCRVAGNLVSPDVLGSLEFSTEIMGAKVVLVLGHSSCGAIKGAIAGAKTAHLTQLLERIRPAIEATEYAGERTVENLEFVDAVARRHVLRTVEQIRRSSASIAELERRGAVQLVGAFYDVGSGLVERL
jgi:carbonic anhydrase